MIGRRTFIAGLGSVAAWPVVAQAQQRTMPVLVLVSLGSADSFAGYVAAFRTGLGWFLPSVRSKKFPCNRGFLRPCADGADWPNNGGQGHRRNAGPPRTRSICRSDLCFE